MLSEGFAIELYLDPALENQVLKAWNVLARRQISTELIEMESRPHITLFSAPLLELSKLQPLLNSFSSKHPPLPLSLSSISSFSTDTDSNNKLFLSPTPSLSLLQFHSQLFDLIRKEGIDVPLVYAPDYWIPHCSVAHHVPKSRFAEAFSLLRDLKFPVHGYATELALVQFSPVRELCSFPLPDPLDP